MAARKAEEDKNPIGYAKNHHNPVYECQRAIEKLAKYDFKWKDSITNPAFVTYAWVSKDSKVIEMYGDQAQAQNGFGAYKMSSIPANLMVKLAKFYLMTSIKFNEKFS
jgi:hypothetical protein